MSASEEWSPETLRARAEAQADILADHALADNKNLSLETLRTLVHELQVHQIELEMQNDELRKSELKLDAARGRYFDLYDLAPVGYCTVNEQGLILETNLMAAVLMDTARSDLVNQPVSRFILKADQDTYYRCRKALFDIGSAQECELQMLQRSGTQFWVHLRMSAAQDAQGATVQRMVLSDISERKRLDGLLQSKNQELEVARAVADRASQAKSDLLSSMTHELRTPLNAILGFAQLIDMGSPPPTAAQKSKVNQIIRAGWYLLGLIGEILDLTSIESGQLTVAVQRVPVAELFSDCQSLMEELASKRDIHLEFSANGVNLAARADRTRLKQVMVNLLSNAIKYNRPGGTVKVTCRQHAGRRLRICVQDSGEGLTSEKLAQLFQPFNRLGHENTTEEGTGIGLAVSKRLAELMGGTIGVQSAVGVGSEFWVDLAQADGPGESLL
jgi:PAS domain S-box-containing protein